MSPALRVFFTHACVVLIAIFVLEACGPSKEPLFPRTATKAGAEGARPSGGPRLSSVAESLFPRTENLILNGSFEDKDETGRPRGWAVSPPSVMVKGPVLPTDVLDGEQSMKVQGVDDMWGVLMCEVPITPDCAGKTLFVSAQARAPLDFYLYLSVECEIDGNSHELARASWPACPDNWTPVYAKARIPEDADPRPVRVRITLRNQSGFVCLVDDVRAVWL